MGKRKMGSMAAMLAALAAQPQAVQAGEKPEPVVKDMQFGTFVSCQHPEHPELTARGVILGDAPVDAPKGIHLAYMVLPGLDPNAAPSKVITFVQDSEIEVSQRVESDDTLFEDARREASRILSNRATNRASFEAGGRRFAAIGDILEKANFGTATPRNVDCLGRFFYMVDKRNPDPVRRFGIVVGVDLAAQNVPSYMAVLAYRADPSEAGKECNCGQVHEVDPKALQMVPVAVENLEATENVDESIRRDAMLSVGADVDQKRNNPDQHSMMVAFGMKPGIADFCEGFQFADDSLAAFKDALDKGEILQA